MIERVLAKTGETVWARAMMYKAVDQLVLLYDSENWVVTGEMLNFLEGFQHREARRITGITATHGAVKKWGYSPVVAGLKTAGLHPIMEYIRRRRSIIAEILACLPIYEL